MILQRTTTAAHQALALIRSIKDALGTEETGEALVEVARNSHKAEMELAAQQRANDLDQCDGQVQVECIRAGSPSCKTHATGLEQSSVIAVVRTCYTVRRCHGYTPRTAAMIQATSRDDPSQLMIGDKPAAEHHYVHGQVEHSNRQPISSYLQTVAEADLGRELQPFFDHCVPLWGGQHVP
jgi:hypothetical protein